ncbi:aminopeptidase [Oribacterium sp. P6A1]|uniref:aminopeptidase n=1 Tax=Oribacterium sp. P6A1 TaxID=1410612 RepID=UPI00056766EB|nr:aminopeptidase [Oribacterium sp. P6A1]
MERYYDAIERIRQIPEEKAVPETFRDYFMVCAEFILKLNDFIEETKDKDLSLIVFSENEEGKRLQGRLREWNRILYSDMAEGYENSYLNPQYSEKRLSPFGGMLSVLLMEIECLIPAAYEKNLSDITAVLETFIQIYCMFESGCSGYCGKRQEQSLPDVKAVKDVLYSYAFDYSWDFIHQQMTGQYIPDGSYTRSVLLNHDFKTAEDIYLFGCYVSDTALKTAEFVASLPDTEIDRMAYTWYKGFKDGFMIQGKPYEKKSLIEFRYQMGYERVLKRTAEYFKEDGYDFTLPRRSGHFITRSPKGAGSLYESPNRQMDYDHSYDLSLVMGDRIASRMIEETEQIFRSFGDEIKRYAGPVVMEGFGEPDFEPREKEERLRFTEHQKEVYGGYRNDLQLLVHRFILEEERSFTIIAWPLPSIGEDFEKILHETVKINTMSSEAYMPVQSKIIDALDKASFVRVKGKGNDTDMTVMLHKLENPEKQSNFENCLSDVNIPLGEVFTSPVLKGTTGVLNVKSVFIEGLQFKNLRLEFRDGRVTDYSCDNFESPEASKALIRRVIFGEKENLPIGEFAIGTNTIAYKMIEKYRLGSKMPILIAEKTGPHFAVGDTCYSFMEDMKLFNPDGKELIAKENECSSLRRTSPEKAYFAVHTDITIPYNELDSIVAVTERGQEISIISDGRFVLEGTEVLNAPLEDR